MLPVPGNTCIEPVGALPEGPVYAVDIDGHLAAIVSGRTVVLSDLTNPSQPSELGTVALPAVIQGIDLVGDYVFAAADRAGLQVVDVERPSAPVVVGWLLDSDNAPISVETDGHHTFVGKRPCPWAVPWCYSSLQVAEILEPTEPSKLGFVGTWGGPNSLAFREGYVFATTFNALHVIDCRAPTAPEVITTLELDGPGHALALEDWKAHVATGRQWYPGYSAALRVFDIRDPLRSRAVELFETPGWGKDVAVSGNIDYLADGDAGLLIFDVSLCGLPEPRRPDGRVAPPSPQERQPSLPRESGGTVEHGVSRW